MSTAAARKIDLGFFTSSPHCQIPHVLVSNKHNSSLSVDAAGSVATGSGDLAFSSV